MRMSCDILFLRGEDMRNFYIFQIPEEIEVTFKNNPFELFHALEMIYYRTYQPSFQYSLVIQLIEAMDVKEMDIFIYRLFKDNYFYTKYKTVHSMHDVYRRENSVLELHKTYLNLKTDSVTPRFLEGLKKYHRLFFCDFDNIDYFWLDSLKIG